MHGPWHAAPVDRSFVATFPLRCWQSASARGSGDCPRTVWCRAHILMLKHSLPARTDASGASEKLDTWSKGGAQERVVCNDISVMVLAERVGLWIRRLSQHGMMPAARPDAQTLATRAHRRFRRVRNFRYLVQGSARESVVCNVFSVTVLAERVEPWTRRLSQHGMVPD